VADDCGSCSLRAVQMATGSRGPRVIHRLNVEQARAGPSGQKDAPAGKSGPPAISPTAGLDQFDSRRTGLLMGSADVEYCLLTVPEAVWTNGTADLAEAIRWEVGRQLSRPIEDAELGAWPLPAAMGGGANAMAVAASRNTITAAVDSLARESFDCEWVEPAAPALVRACRASAQSSQGEIWGVLDLGFSAYRLYVAVESTPVFARQVRGSGHAWTQLVAKELRTDYAVAEYYKCKCGIGADTRESRTLMGSMDRLDESALPGVLLTVLNGSMGELVADVERAFSFVMEQYPRRQAGSLVLTGGGARMPGLTEWIGHELGVPVAIASANGILQLPPNHVLSQSETFSVMAGCIGMALAEVAR
jgi:type IV pilus assembly protein PilM